MNLKRFSFFIFFIIPFYLFSNNYEDGLQLEAQGDIKKALIKYNEYLDLEINSEPNDLLLERLIYISTLYDSLDDATLFLINRAKQIKNKDLRSEIYFKIANIYELTGKIFNAGVYYEKSSYGNSGVDYNKLLNSLYMLYEIGYYEKVIQKIQKIPLKEEKLSNDYNILYYLCLVKTNKNRDALILLTKLEENNSYFRNNKDFETGSMYERIYKDFIELKNLSNYVNKTPVKLNINNKKEIKSEIITIGKYKELPGGVINILEQLEYSWQFKNDLLTIRVNNKEDDMLILEKAGIDFEN